jgi:DNA-binding NtrC family response regulator
VAVATVLIVEDEPTLLDVSCRVLAKAGYEVLGASDAEDALEIIRDTAVDLILSDAIMPGMPGPALLELVGQAAPGTALMLMSASKQAPARGVTFLRKPFTLDELRTAVERTLKRAAMARANLALAKIRAKQPQAEPQQLRLERERAAFTAGRIKASPTGRLGPGNGCHPLARASSGAK